MLSSIFSKSPPSAEYTRLNKDLQDLDKKAKLVSEHEINRDLITKFKYEDDHYQGNYAAFKLLTPKTFINGEYKYEKNDVLDPSDPIYHLISGKWPNMNVSYAGVRVGQLEVDLSVTPFSNLADFLKKYVLVEYYDPSGGKSRRRRRKKRVSRKNRRSRKR